MAGGEIGGNVKQERRPSRASKPNARPVLHFFPRFGRHAAETPFNDYLRQTGANYRIIASDVHQGYARRWQLLVLGYPRLLLSALRCARQSMLSRQENPPDAVLISSDVEALVFALVRSLPGAARPDIFFMPFIFTERRSQSVNRVRRLYYRLVLRTVDVAICHSRLEVPRYQRIFSGSQAEFIFVPWGTYVPSPDDILARSQFGPQQHTRPIVVAAGRSGRDYATFVQAARKAGCAAVIVCNDHAALRGIDASNGVTILSRCFGMDYLAQMLSADIVAVPLAVHDISAGQMVLIQAMALGRPLIVTETPTIGDYLEHGKDALLVRLGDSNGMAEAMVQLTRDGNLRESLGACARATYLARFSGAAHVANVVTAVERYLAER